MQTIDLSQYGYLVLCVESSKHRTLKVVELTGEFPNISTSVVVSGIPSELELVYSRCVSLHNDAL